MEGRRGSDGTLSSQEESTKRCISYLRWSGVAGLSVGFSVGSVTGTLTGTPRSHQTPKSPKPGYSGPLVGHPPDREEGLGGDWCRPERNPREDPDGRRRPRVPPRNPPRVYTGDPPRTTRCGEPHPLPRPTRFSPTDTHPGRGRANGVVHTEPVDWDRLRVPGGFETTN